MTRNRGPQQAPQHEAPQSTGLLPRGISQEQSNPTRVLEEVANPTTSYESRFQADLAVVPIQKKIGIAAKTSQSAGTQTNPTGMPDNLKSGLEHLSGMDMNAVRVHYNSFKPAKLNALAYTRGRDIHIGPGQEKYLAHEGWHVVQQMQGRVRPTAKAKSISINNEPMLENEADAMGTKANNMVQTMEKTATWHRANNSMSLRQRSNIFHPNLLQLKRYDQGERLNFSYKGSDFSGMVIKVHTDSDSDNEIIYEVDTNMDGDQQSLLVQDGKVLKIQSPSSPNIDPKSITTILDMPVTTLDQTFIESNKIAQKEGGGIRGAEEGDVMVGRGILIKKRNITVSDKPSLQELSKQNFQSNVLVDLTIIATTKSGQLLLKSIETAAQSNGKVVLIDWVNGHRIRSNAGQWGSGGVWNTRAQKPGKPANSNIGYNPSVLGLPMKVGLNEDDSMMKAHDEIVWPALKDKFGRPKEKPSDVTLFHELVHADDILHGRLYTQEVPSGNFDKSKVSEMHAVGLEEYYDEDFISGKTEFPTIYSENTYRHERGFALRPWYKDQQENKKYTSDYTDREKALELLPIPKLKYKKLRFKKTVRKHEQDVERVKKENERRKAEYKRAKARSQHNTSDIRANRKALLEDIRDSNAAVIPKSIKKRSKKSVKKSAKKSTETVGKSTSKKATKTKKKSGIGSSSSKRGTATGVYPILFEEFRQNHSDILGDDGAVPEGLLHPRNQDRVSSSSQKVDKQKEQKIMSELRRKQVEQNLGLRQWLARNGIRIVRNSGDHMNCLIISLLMHATGKYVDDHDSAAKNYRQRLVWQFKDVQEGDMLYSDNPAFVWLVKQINQEYHVSMDVVLVQADEYGCPYIVAQVNTGSDKVVIFDQGGHYEALHKSA